MTEKDLKSRTKHFALRIIKLVNSMPKTTAGIEFGKQIFCSGTSVASNYRAACRAKSKKDFTYKLEVVLEEADETLLWLELIGDSETVAKKKLEPLMDEANQLVSIFSKSVITTKRKSDGNLTSKI